MIEVTVESVRISLINQQRLVVLRETNGPRYLPIWIGPFEAEAITMGLHKTEVLRPMTHDLLLGVVGQLGGTVERIHISDLQDETFYARIMVTLNDRQLEVDSRPSDAIALAVRAEVPITVSEDVMDRAGQVPTPGDSSNGEDGESAADQLQVFRDFIEELDLDLGDDAEEHT
jgi:bifunctional DNase/RNase